MCIRDRDSPEYAMAGTDLAKPLEDAMQSSDNLRAVIMFTAGSHNASSSVLTQAQRRRTRGIPLFIISAGSPYPLPDPVSYTHLDVYKRQDH